MGKGKLIQEGEIQSGLNRYATAVIEETMFPYRPSQRPMFGGNSLFGKLFWQYGTYSSGYVANLWRGIKNGTPAQKVAFVTRLAASTAIIGGIFKELSINNKNFMPWTPVGFSGGPFINVGFDIMKSFNQGYEGESARKRLLDWATSSAIPLSYQVKNIKRGIKAQEAGDYYTAWLLFTSTPVDPEKMKDYY